jgi:hypothetical protein
VVKLEFKTDDELEDEECVDSNDRPKKQKRKLIVKKRRTKVRRRIKEEEDEDEESSENSTDDEMTKQELDDEENEESTSSVKRELGEKSHKCHEEGCNKAYGSQAALRVHLRKHEEDSENVSNLNFFFFIK